LVVGPGGQQAQRCEVSPLLVVTVRDSTNHRHRTGDRSAWIVHAQPNHPQQWTERRSW
jgi:hypothetical protein